MLQEEVRKELKEFLKSKGVKNKYIANYAGLTDASISMFLHDKRDLSRQKLDLILEYIKINN